MNENFNLNNNELENFMIYFKDNWLKYFKDGILKLKYINIRLRSNYSLGNFNGILKRHFYSKKKYSICKFR